MSMALQETRQALEQYLQALVEHDDFGEYFSDDVAVTFAGADQRANGREAATQLIAAAHELGDMTQLVSDVVAVERASFTTDVVERTGSLKIGDFAKAKMEAFQGPFGKATNLQESLFATYPGVPAHVSTSRKHTRHTAKHGVSDVDLEGRNAVRSMFHFEA